jgi:hypothetical protein
MGRHEAPSVKWVRRGVWATILCAVAGLIGAGATLAAPLVSSWRAAAGPSNQVKPTPGPNLRNLVLKIVNGGKIPSSHVLSMMIKDADLAVGEYAYVLVQAQGDPLWHARECRKAGVEAICAVQFPAVGAPAWWNLVGVVVTSDGAKYLDSKEHFPGSPPTNLAAWLLGITDLDTVAN